MRSVSLWVLVAVLARLQTAGTCDRLSLSLQDAGIGNFETSNRTHCVRLRILYVEGRPDLSVSYYTETVRSLQKLHKVKYLLFPRAGLADRQARIRHAIGKDTSRFHVVLFGWGYLTDPPDQWLPIEYLQSFQIPLAFILNKEYSLLEAKLSYIKRCKPVVAFSAHHEVRKFMAYTGVPFYRTPFAATPRDFNFLTGKTKYSYKYDFGFTGRVRAQQTQNWRTLILQDKENLKNLGVRIFTQGGHNFHPIPLEKYKKAMKHTKIWLSTTGPLDLVGTRFFEVLMSGTTMLICNRLPLVYEGLFRENKHAVMFSTLEELRRKVEYYMKNEQERRAIVSAAHRLALRNHTYNVRADQLGQILQDVLHLRGGFK